MNRTSRLPEVVTGHVARFLVITIAIRHVGVDEAHFSYRAWESSDGYVDFAILTDEPFTTSLTPTGYHLVTT